VRTVAFYSYKGGTGRTLALANTARFAATIGKRVVVIDMDLEAPGLTYKLLRGNQTGVRNRGLVGCLLDTMHGGDVPEDLGEYLIDVELTTSNFLERTTTGWLKLMAAGSVPSPNYFGELRRLALDARTADGSATELLRAVIARLEKDYSPDLVLIDARTGITNTNTLVLSELADDLFAFFLDLPEQLDGTRMILRSVAPLTRDESRPLHIYGVISRVPVGNDQINAGWLETEADAERKERIERFLLEPAGATTFSLDSIRLLPLHHEAGLVDLEAQLLGDLAADSPATAPLLWDYARLADAAVGDPQAVGQAVEHLAGRRQGSLSALLTGIPSLRAEPSTSTDLGMQSTEPTIREAIDSIRASAARDPRLAADLAWRLEELALAQRAIGNLLDAVAPTEEAVTIYRDLAATNPAFRGDLARSLNILGASYSDTGRPLDALTPTEEAVAIYRDLAARNPDFRGNLASSLSNVGIRYGEIGRSLEALAVTKEAVTLKRDLAATNPAARSELASSLNNLGIRYIETGQPLEALAPTEEAVTINRDLAATNPAFRSNLASALTNLGAMYSQTGRPLEAVTPTEEAVTIYRDLAATNPALHSELASALTNLGAMYSETGRPLEALAPTEEAVTINRNLAATNSAHHSKLARSLNILGIRYIETGRPL
jgi:tetratricopeptide (TPR) repeat protein